MNMKLFFQAILKFLAGVILVGLLVFLPAGTIKFFNGWLLMGVLFVPMLLAGIVMMIKSPQLLKKRLNAKEKRGEQSIIVKLSGLMFIGGFVVAGLDHRFGWFPLPLPVVIMGAVIFLIGYGLYAEVMRENAYLSRTIEVQENQKVIDTGLYAIVRHPMYTATIILFLSIPLILGSAFSLLVFLPYPILIAKRAMDEEKLLEQELKGYREYTKKVKYRLIPFIW